MEIKIKDLTIADFKENHRVNFEVINTISNGLMEYNWEVRPDPSAAPLVLAIEQNGQTVGGATGRSAYGWMRVDVIWVDAEVRGKGYGEQLLQQVEAVARDRRCRGIHLDTHGFQAPAFYLKNGYQIFGELPDYPLGENHYFLKKELIGGEV